MASCCVFLLSLRWRAGRGRHPHLGLSGMCRSSLSWSWPSWYLFRQDYTNIWITLSRTRYVPSRWAGKTTSSAETMRQLRTWQSSAPCWRHAGTMMSIRVSILTMSSARCHITQKHHMRNSCSCCLTSGNSHIRNPSWLILYDIGITYRYNKKT